MRLDTVTEKGNILQGETEENDNNEISEKVDCILIDEDE